MININRKDFIGKGAHRECYKHPENKDLCIKLNFFNDQKEIKREKDYYRHLEKRRISWEMIPRYYGDIVTNLGVGSVFDLITDQDSSVSKDLTYYLSSQKETEKHYDSLLNSVLLLKKYLSSNRIITMNLDPNNILCQKTELGISRLFIVDNVYNTEFIPISSYINYFAKLKISRKWKRFERSLLYQYNNNKALRDMMTRLRYLNAAVPS
jgi:hypothetical protein